MEPSKEFFKHSKHFRVINKFAYISIYISAVPKIDYNDLKRLSLNHIFTENFESTKNFNKVLRESYLFMPLNLPDNKCLHQ